MNSYSWIPKWIPNKSFGSIVLGDDINKYRTELNLQRIEDIGENEDNFSYYLLGFDVSIDTEDGKVSSVSVRDECIYKGINIIGMKITELADLLGCFDYQVEEGIVHDDGDIRTPVHFDKFGLQAWFSCNVLVTASIADYTED